jgi:hypothetical protein
MTLRCETCRGERWTCEFQSDRPVNHDDCDGASAPCPDCQTPGVKPKLPPDRISMTSTEDPEILLNCPVCAAPMAYVETHGATHIYRCLVHERFLFPPDDQVRPEPQ